MASTRWLNEIKVLQEPNNDYAVEFYDEQMYRFRAVINAPDDSVYEDTFIVLDVEINPMTYPAQPPIVKFLNLTSKRLHPNLYESGDICLSILNTWEGPQWKPTIRMHNVLISIQNLLDTECPYIYEPGGRDDPSYTTYVRYESFRLLVEYLYYLPSGPVKSFIEKNIEPAYLLPRIENLSHHYDGNVQHTKCFYVGQYFTDYKSVYATLLEWILSERVLNFEDSTCPICDEQITLVNAAFLAGCPHSFHSKCIKQSLSCYGPCCPTCEKPTIYETYNDGPIEKTYYDPSTNEDLDVKRLPDGTTKIKNPTTGHMVSTTGKTFMSLLENKLIAARPSS